MSENRIPEAEGGQPVDESGVVGQRTIEDIIKDVRSVVRVESPDDGVLVPVSDLAVLLEQVTGERPVPDYAHDITGKGYSVESCTRPATGVAPSIDGDDREARES